MASVFTENNWQQLTPLPTPRAVTWALARQWPGQANAIYQVGGFRGTGTPTTAGYTADIERTPVNGDGTLGQPVVAGQIPVGARGNCGATIYNDRLYIITGDGPGAGVISWFCWGNIQGDGSISQMSFVQLPEQFAGSRLVVANGWIYIIGGTFAPANFGNGNIYSAPIYSDGSPGPFQVISTPLPTGNIGLGHSTVFEKGGYLYLAGGLNGFGGVFNASAGIWSARVQANGQLDPWVSLGAMSTPRWRHGVVVVDDQIFWGGGNAGNPLATVLSSVDTAYREGEGQLSKLRVLTNPLPAALRNCRLMEVNGIIYSIGGADGTNTALAAVNALSVKW